MGVVLAGIVDVGKIVLGIVLVGGHTSRRRLRVGHRSQTVGIIVAVNGLVSVLVLNPIAAAAIVIVELHSDGLARIGDGLDPVHEIVGERSQLCAPVHWVL